MLKKILKLDGSKELSKKEQKEISGGYRRFYCITNQQCRDYYDEQAVVCIRNGCLFL
jgi:hypothetical protein